VSITIRAGLGTGGLLGLSGTFRFENLGSHHTYAFYYAMDNL
jgi:hypothetical protein